MSRQKLGQHFLSNPTILERIAAAACAPDEPLAVEIGPGTGTLTEHLLARARRVVAIEIDDALVVRLRQRFAQESRLEIVSGDALQIDLGQWGPAVLCGNLPYYAATAILERAVRLGPQVRHSVFLVQKEVAQRVTAVPGTREYGYLTAMLALFARSELLFEVKPGAFRPPPQVESAVLRLQYAPRAMQLGITDPEAFRRFLAACFRQKRKTLRNNLRGIYATGAIEKGPELALRAEQLTVERLASLYCALANPAR
jgi:16S rRNA (adenine1518-N6/adenine1519-N6)-dimethyltransferase